MLFSAPANPVREQIYHTIFFLSDVRQIVYFDPFFGNCNVFVILFTVFDICHTLKNSRDGKILEMNVVYIYITGITHGLPSPAPAAYKQVQTEFIPFRIKK